MIPFLQSGEIREEPLVREKESTFKPAMLLMAGRALASIGTLLIPVTLVRVFDQSEYGTYKQLFLVFASLYSVALIGLSDSLYYFVPGEASRGGRYVANALVGLSLAGSVCVALLHGGRNLIAGWMGNPALADYLGSIGAFLFFTLLATVLEIALIARKRYLQASTAYVVSDVARAACFVVPMLIAPGLRELMAWAVAFSVLRFVAAMVLLKKEFGADLKPDSTLLPGQLAYALPFAVYVLVEILQSTFHQYAVSWTFDAATFAIYSVGCFQVPFVDFLATPASSVMMVRMTEEMRAGRPRDAVAIWLDITRKLALIFFPMVAFLAVASREVITFLFTDAYAASAPIFALWVMSIALSVLQTDGVMRVLAQVRFLSIVNVVRLLLIVVLIHPFIAGFGLQGPVLITLLALGVAKVLHLLRFKKEMKLGVEDLLPWRPLQAVALSSVLAIAPVLVAREFVTGPRLVVLLVAGLAYTLTYAQLLFLTGALTAEERLDLRRRLHLATGARLAAAVPDLPGRP